METTKQKVQFALVALMDEHGTKGTELANAIGVKKQSVSGWRRGETSMDIDNMIAVCDYYDITLDDFVGRGKEIEDGADVIAVSAKERELISSLRDLSHDELEIITLMRDMDDAQQAVLLSLAYELARKA